MPWLYCQKRKQKMKVNIEVCFGNRCPHIDEKLLTCDFKPISQKRIEKRKKK